MSYLQANHKYLYVPSGGTNKQLIVPPAVEIPQQINLLTSPDGLDFASIPTITGTQTIKADLHIDDSSSTFILYFKTITVNDFLLMNIGVIPDDEMFGLCITTKLGQFIRVRQIYTIDSYLGINVAFELVKGTGTITSVKMNGDTLTKRDDGSLDPTDNNYKYFKGTNGLSIWNLEIVGAHKWIGYPYGNQSSAWVDTVGTNDGTITGSPGTRDLL